MHTLTHRTPIPEPPGALDAQLAVEFLRDGRAQVARLDRALAAAGDGPAPAAVVTDVVRTVHTLKGTALFLGLDGVVCRLHSLEQRLIDLGVDGEDRSATSLRAALTRLAALLGPDHGDGADDLCDAPTARSDLWAPLPHFVRRLAATCGLRVRFDLVVERVELDREVAEALRVGLLHSLRNAVGHGIEPAAERRACGKPMAGAVGVDGRHDGDGYAVTVRDDGSGLDVGALRALAADDAELTELACRPGLTTAADADAVAGRGFGLDAARSAVEGVGGTLAIASAAGIGCAVTMRVPLTLA